MKTEAQIQAEIIKWLQKNHIPVWRISETKNLIGFPDLLTIVPTTGQFVGIEVKTESGYVSSIQAVVHKIIQEANGRVIIARKLEDVINVFNQA